MGTAVEGLRDVAVPGPTGAAALRAWRSMLTDPLAGFAGLRREYGPAVRVPYAPGRAAYLLSGAEHAEHVLVARQANYRKAFTYRPLRMVLGDGLLTSEGETWAAHRRIVQPVFAKRHLDPFVPAIADTVATRLEAWSCDAPIDAAAEMRRMTLDIVGRALFGADLAAEADELGHALATLQAGNLLGAGVALVPGRLGDALLRNTRRIPRFGAQIRRLDRLVDTMVASRRATAPEGDANLLDLLLAHSAGPEGEGLSDGELHDEVLTLVLAGHETTAAALSWTLAELSRHPGARERVEAEADAVLGSAAPITAADVDRLEWTHAVLQESMRLHPPAWTIEREALGDDVVGGAPVPAGSTVAVPPYLLHRDPEVWPDPERFHPSRFIGVHERPRCAYLPFGAGRRICVGSAFAMMEATLALAMIAREHRLDLVGDFPHGRAEVTLRPAGAMPMRVARRR